MRIAASILILLSALTSFGQGVVRHVPTIAQLLQINPTSSAIGDMVVYEVDAPSSSTAWGAPRLAYWSRTSIYPNNGTNVFNCTFGGQWIFPDRTSPIQDSRWYSWASTNNWSIDKDGNFIIGTTNVASYLATLNATKQTTNAILSAITSGSSVTNFLAGDATYKAVATNVVTGLPAYMAGVDVGISSKQEHSSTLDTIANGTGANSTNFFSGGGVFRQVTTNDVPGLNALLTSLQPSGSYQPIGNYQPSSSVLSNAAAGGAYNVFFAGDGSFKSVTTNMVPGLNSLIAANDPHGVFQIGSVILSNAAANYLTGPGSYMQADGIGGHLDTNAVLGLTTLITNMQVGLVPHGAQIDALAALNPSAPNTRGVVIGEGASAATKDSIAIGTTATISSGSLTSTGAVAIGGSSSAAGINSMALGFTSKALAHRTVALGIGTTGGDFGGTASDAMALGNYSTAANQGSVAIGPWTSTDTNFQVRIGNVTNVVDVDGTFRVGRTNLFSLVSSKQNGSSALTNLSAGGLSTNFWAGDSTFKQVTTNMIPGLNGMLTGLQPSGSYQAANSTLTNVISGSAATNFFAGDGTYKAITESMVSNLVSDLAGKAASSHNHDASNITSGIIAPARLGSSTPTTNTFLRGDGQWASLTTNGSVSAGSNAIYVAANYVTNLIAGPNIAWGISGLQSFPYVPAGTSITNLTIGGDLTVGSTNVVGALAGKQPSGSYQAASAVLTNLINGGTNQTFFSWSGAYAFVTTNSIPGLTTVLASLQPAGSYQPATTFLTNVAAGGASTNFLGGDGVFKPITTNVISGLNATLTALQTGSAALSNLTANPNLYQQSNSVLTTVGSLGNSSNFWAGGGSYRQVTTNDIPGLNGMLTANSPSGSYQPASLALTNLSSTWAAATVLLNGTAIGASSVAGSGGSSYGYQAYSGNNAVAGGATSSGAADYSIAIGYGSSVPVGNTYSIAIGTTSSATATNALAIGPSASAAYPNSVAIGQGAVAGGTNVITLGGASHQVSIPGGSLSIGGTNIGVMLNARQVGSAALTNLAAGSASTNFWAGDGSFKAVSTNWVAGLPGYMSGVDSAIAGKQAASANLSTVSALTGGTSGNFFRGDGTFSGVTTNNITGLNSMLTGLAPLAAPTFSGVSTFGGSTIFSGAANFGSSVYASALTSGTWPYNWHGIVRDDGANDLRVVSASDEVSWLGGPFSVSSHYHAYGSGIYIGPTAPGTIGLRSIGIGWSSGSLGSGSIEIGDSAAAAGGTSVAIGLSANASGSIAIAIGDAAQGTGAQSAAIGYGATASGSYSSALGFGASGTGYGSVGIGYQSHSTHDHSFAIGHLASTTRTNQVMLGGSSSDQVVTPGELSAGSITLGGVNKTAWPSTGDAHAMRYVTSNTTILPSDEFLFISTSALIITMPTNGIPVGKVVTIVQHSSNTSSIAYPNGVSFDSLGNGKAGSYIFLTAFGYPEWLKVSGN